MVSKATQTQTNKWTPKYFCKKIIFLTSKSPPEKTLWCKNQNNPSHRKSRTWAPLITGMMSWPASAAACCILSPCSSVPVEKIQSHSGWRSLLTGILVASRRLSQWRRQKQLSELKKSVNLVFVVIDTVDYNDEKKPCHVTVSLTMVTIRSCHADLRIRDVYPGSDRPIPDPRWKKHRILDPGSGSQQRID